MTLSRFERQLLRTMRAHSTSVDAVIFAKQVPGTREELHRDFEALREKGHAEEVPGEPGHWRLTGQGRNLIEGS